VRRNEKKERREKGENEFEEDKGRRLGRNEKNSEEGIVGRNEKNSGEGRVGRNEKKGEEGRVVRN
jgi:hypothetical protein